MPLLDRLLVGLRVSNYHYFRLHIVRERRVGERAGHKASQTGSRACQLAELFYRRLAVFAGRSHGDLGYAGPADELCSDVNSCQSLADVKDVKPLGIGLDDERSHELGLDRRAYADAGGKYHLFKIIGIDSFLTFRGFVNRRFASTYAIVRIVFGIAHYAEVSSAIPSIKSFHGGSLYYGYRKLTRSIMIWKQSMYQSNTSRSLEKGQGAKIGADT